MRHTFHDGHWNDNERRLIRQQNAPEFAQMPAPGQGRPSYEQLYYNYQQAIKRLQQVERQILNMQTNPPRAAQNWAAQEAATAQQMHWYRMGGPFAMGAAPLRYPNIGSHARWNNQMQYMQYQQQWLQQQQQPRQPQAPQPEYMRSLGRRPDAAGPSGAPGRRRDVRRVAPRGQRSAEMQERNTPVRNQQDPEDQLPILRGHWIGPGGTKRDMQENNVYFYRNTPEGYVAELVRSRGRFVREERAGREPPDAGNVSGDSTVTPNARPGANRAGPRPGPGVDPQANKRFSEVKQLRDELAEIQSDRKKAQAQLEKIRAGIQVGDSERQAKSLTARIVSFNKRASSLEADIKRRLELEARYRREL